MYLDIGGVETQILSQIGNDSSKLYSWAIVAEMSQKFASRAEKAGADVFSWKPHFLFDIFALFRLCKWVSGHEVDILHSHDPRAMVYASLVGLFIKIPVVSTTHLSFEAYHSKTWKPIRKIFFWIEKLLNHRLICQTIFVSSQVYEKALESNLVSKEKSIVIHNGIDPRISSHFVNHEQKRKTVGAREDIIVLCCVARLDVQKGIDLLIKAASYLLEEGETFEVWMVGDGPEEISLRSLAENMKVNSVFRFLGERDDVFELLLSSDIFVLPSRYEGMSYSILEAMSVGLPCVVTAVGENSKLIQSGKNGFLVLPEDAISLSKSLQLLIRSENLRCQMGSLALKTAKLYQVKTMMDLLESVYQSCFPVPGWVKPRIDQRRNECVEKRSEF